MKYTEKEVLQFVEENDVKFVKLMFCDIFGSLKTISVIPGELPKIFREGLISMATAARQGSKIFLPPEIS